MGEKEDEEARQKDNEEKEVIGLCIISVVSIKLK